VTEVLGSVVAAAIGAVLAVTVAHRRSIDRPTASPVRLADAVGARLGPRTPPRWRNGLAGRLVAAGEDPGLALDRAIGLRLLAVAAAVSTAVMGIAVSGRGAAGVLVVLLVAVSLALLPEVRLRRRIADRGSRLRHDLPRQLDLLVIAVEAGLGFDQALDRVVRASPGPLADEFARLLTELRVGMPRSDALRGLATRCPLPEIRSFAMAMIQADTYGVAVGPLLRSQAEETRMRLRQRAQFRAQRAPVALLVPMVLCIFPALLVVIAGPALLSVRELFSGSSW
jgi:tight adherence protein C